MPLKNEFTQIVYVPVKATFYQGDDGNYQCGRAEWPELSVVRDYQFNRISYGLDEQQSAAAVDWITNHECRLDGKYPGAIGGTISFIFTYTTIGTLGTVKCACGREKMVMRP